MKRLIFPFFLIFLTGCLFPPVFHENVSHNSRFPSDYIAGETYRTQCTLAVVKMDEELTLFPQNDYPNDGFAGYIPSGSLLRISKLELEKDLRMETDVVWVRARFLDGPFIGKRVQLSFISHDIYNPSVNAFVPFVNTNILKLVTKP